MTGSSQRMLVLSKPLAWAGVLGVTAVAPTLEQARERAYAAAAPIEWEGMQLRHDIAALVPGAPVGAGEGAR